MKQTEHLGLNLMEAADLLSARPLNENAEKIDAALNAAAQVSAGKAMMACGSYTGDGKRTVTIQTPGFKPQVVLMRDGDRIASFGYGYSAMSVREGWCLWLGTDLAASYTVVRDDNMNTVKAAISFVPEAGKLSWSIPKLGTGYTGVTADGGPAAMNNDKGTVYQWIALGVAE